MRDPMNQQLQGTAREIVPGQIARHYKGGLYRVTGLVRIEANSVPAVAYAPLDRTKSSMTWIRPVAEFLEILNDQERFALAPVPSMAGIEHAIPSFVMSKDAVEAVLSYYDAPYRYYHTREHVLEMFNRALAESIVLSPEQALAILFHDAMYVPGAPAGFNEKASAQLVQLFKERINLSTLNLQVVQQIIEDTAEHKPTNPESLVVLDLDLIGLAGHFNEFALAWELNRLECAHLVAQEENPRSQFDRARLRTLLQMCQEPKLFHSHRFATEANEDAFRRNVEVYRKQWLAENKA